MGVPTSFILWITTAVCVCLTSVESFSTSLGCYTDNEEKRDLEFEGPVTNRRLPVSSCISACRDRYFRYAGIQNGEKCFCGSSYGHYTPTLCTKNCTEENVTLECGGELVNSIYETNQTMPGPPKNLQVMDITPTSMNVTWDPPEADNVYISEFSITATPVKTYAEILETPLKWSLPNNTKYYELLDLHAGTTYNVSIQSLGASLSQGHAISTQAATKIGDPETPDPPVLLQKKSDNSITIKLHKGISYNGPVTSYQIVVGIGLGLFNPNLLGPYNNDNSNFYIAAEIAAEDLTEEFTVGDGETYGSYYNARLPNDPVQIREGVVSKHMGETRVSYSEAPPAIMDFDDGLDEFLKVGIIVCAVLLILLSIAYFLTRRHFNNKRRRHMATFPHELSVHGPMIEVENLSYIPEEEESNRPSHYERLKNQVWLIPLSQLDIDMDKILGQGPYGVVVKGAIMTHDDHSENAVFCIRDGELSPIAKRMMLQDLDELIRVGSNCTHVQAMVGTCESPDMLYVVFDHHPATLKDVLLESRALERAGSPNGQSACTLSPQTLLHICSGVATGMEHLHACKVLHKQVCALSVVMADGMVPKIANFGISKMNRPDDIMDLTRWTAHESLSSNVYLPKSDVWSMGVLLWEVAALGGTPYASVRSKPELVKRITRGMLPHQPSGTSDQFYQLMLQCWQLDVDERPSFGEIVSTLSDFADSGEIVMDLSAAGGFRYEPYTPECERFGF